MNPQVVPHMNRSKCQRCGLVCPTASEVCRRCGASLTPADNLGPQQEIKKRGIRARIIWIVATTLVLLFVAYMSLLITSDDLGFDRRHMVEEAIAILKQKGFERDAFVLGNLVKYRVTDNWWNEYVGHHEAYAA